jgi:hypothetical protein
VKLHLDISGVDPATEWFLCRHIPQYYTDSSKLQDWNGRKESHVIVYTNETPGIDNIYIKLFEDKHGSVYVGLYDEQGKRLCDICLVIWNKEHPHVANQGFAPGRCPDEINV